MSGLNVQIWKATLTRNAWTNFLQSSLDVDSASNSSSDLEEWQNFGSAHRLRLTTVTSWTSTILTDIDVSEDEAENSLECLYWKEEGRILRAEGKQLNGRSKSSFLIVLYMSYRN